MRLLSGCLITFITLGLLANSATAAEPNLKVGDPFPNLRGRDQLTGEPFNLENLKGKVVLVEFWATWCSACRDTIKPLGELNRAYKNQGLEIVSVSLDTDMKQLRNFARRYKMKWNHISDGKRWESPLVQEYGIPHIPTIFVLDREGNISAAYAKLPAAILAISAALSDGQPPTQEAQQSARQIFEQAKLHMNKGEIGPAIVQYRRVLAEFPRTTWAEKAQGWIDHFNSDPELKAKADTYFASEKARELLARARELRAEGATVMAKQYYRKVSRDYAETPEAETAKTELGELEG